MAYQANKIKEKKRFSFAFLKFFFDFEFSKSLNPAWAWDKFKNPPTTKKRFICPMLFNIVLKMKAKYFMTQDNAP